MSVHKKYPLLEGLSKLTGKIRQAGINEEWHTVVVYKYDESSQLEVLSCHPG